MTTDRENWSSRLSFYYAAAAAAIGIGSLWRFPYIAGQYGGGTFVLLYVLFVILFCLPVMIAEMSVGKFGKGSPTASVNAAVAQEKTSPFWRLIGYLGLVIPFFGLSYFSVIAGWSLDYARIALFGGFSDITPTASAAMFGELVASPWRQAIMQFVFIAAVCCIIARGIHRGIEVISKIKMISLFLILLILLVYNAIAFGMSDAARYVFSVDAAGITREAVIAAMGQALITAGIGVGVLMTYSSYLPPQISVPQSSAALCLSVILIALMAGFAIFPIVFHFGLEPSAGPGLIFITLPIAFDRMFAGEIIAVMFFFLVVVSAFTSGVGLLEPVVAWLQEKTGLSRVRLSIFAGAAIWLVGLPSLLSFNVFADLRPLFFVPFFADMTIFGLLDYFVANVFLSTNALLILLFMAWPLGGRIARTDFGSEATFHIWRGALRYGPLALIVLLLLLP